MKIDLLSLLLSLLLISDVISTKKIRITDYKNRRCQGFINEYNYQYGQYGEEYIQECMATYRTQCKDDSRALTDLIFILNFNNCKLLANLSKSCELSIDLSHFLDDEGPLAEVLRLFYETMPEFLTTFRVRLPRLRIIRSVMVAFEQPTVMGKIWKIDLVYSPEPGTEDYLSEPIFSLLSANRLASIEIERHADPNDIGSIESLLVIANKGYFELDELKISGFVFQREYDDESDIKQGKSSNDALVSLVRKLHVYALIIDKTQLITEGLLGPGNKDLAHLYLYDSELPLSEFNMMMRDTTLKMFYTKNTFASLNAERLIISSSRYGARKKCKQLEYIGIDDPINTINVNDYKLKLKQEFPKAQVDIHERTSDVIEMDIDQYHIADELPIHRFDSESHSMLTEQSSNRFIYV